MPHALTENRETDIPSPDAVRQQEVRATLDRGIVNPQPFADHADDTIREMLATTDALQCTIDRIHVLEYQLNVRPSNPIASAKISTDINESLPVATIDNLTKKLAAEKEAAKILANQLIALSASPLPIVALPN